MNLQNDKAWIRQEKHSCADDFKVVGYWSDRGAQEVLLMNPETGRLWRKRWFTSPIKGEVWFLLEDTDLPKLKDL